MKKSIFAMTVAVASMFAACTKEYDADLQQKESVCCSGLVFDAEFNVATKAVKTGWVSGDNIVVFFDDFTTKEAASVSDVKYVKFTYDGSSWAADQTNAPDESELSPSGSLCAVYCPFGDGTVSAGDNAGEFYVSKSNAFFLCNTTGSYTFEDGKISFSVTLSSNIDGLCQIYVPGLDATHKYALSVYGGWSGKAWTKGLQKVWTAVFKPADGTFTSTVNSICKPADGYAYGDGFVFYGKASLPDDGALLFELYDNTSKCYYSYSKSSVSKFEGGMAIKLPELASWTAVSAAQVNFYADGTLIINENASSRSGNVLAHGTSTKISDKITNMECASKTDETGALQPWASVRTSIKNVEFGSSFAPKSMWCAFQGCTELLTVNTKNLDLSKCVSLKYAFKTCKKLTTLDVSTWDVSKVNDLRYAFHDCNKLAVLDVSNWNVATVGNMYGVFRGCTSLQVLDMSKWSNSLITRTDEMFRAVSKVKVLDISWIPCALITKTSMMFYQCGALTTIYASGDLNTVATSDREFYQCSTSLVGGNGTVWSSSNIDKTYARIDAAGTPGYFTQK